MYKLTATNQQGAQVIFRGVSKAEVLSDFDFEYRRSGFKIIIEHKNEIIVIKKTFR